MSVHTFKVTAVHPTTGATLTATKAVTLDTTSMLAIVNNTALAAWSIRKLKADYSGYCVKVREDSGDTLADIGFDANGILDVTALAAHLNGANGFVHTWYDQSATGADIVQTTNGLQAKISADGGPNNRPYIEQVKGTTNLPVSTSISGSADDYTFAIIHYQDTDGAYVFDSRDTGVTNRLAIRVQKFAYDGADIFATDMTFREWTNHVITLTAAASNVYQDGNLIEGPDADYDQQTIEDDIHLGNQYNGGGSGGDIFRFAEFIIWADDIDGTELAAVVANQEAVFDIQLDEAL